MNDISEKEAESIAGGFAPAAVTIGLAIGTYIIANWSEAKKGFADGFLRGYNAVQ